MDKIACNVELFDNNFNVFIYKEGEISPIKIPAANAQVTLVQLCRENNIFNLALPGDKKFLDGFIEQIYMTETTMFGKTGKINIEVMD